MSEKYRRFMDFFFYGGKIAIVFGVALLVANKSEAATFLIVGFTSVAVALAMLGRNR